MKELHTLSIDEVHDGLKSGEFTCTQLVQHFLNRIEKYNPKLNIYLSLNPHVLEEAALVDKEISEKGINRPLLGIPVAVKDNLIYGNQET
ncbi:MAG: Glutamyl-tRNA(Gln) amidotransferase subunit A [Candidatus Collierbacteria bacterium GW2011_GWA1_44_12]|uniref:Glutamyl-tRNA(Gln) amidotransferase subunit A n=1 Tax=Candidatus Collierbacteria bacterium GW2011_GWA1_44_12 TaxID=1618376 RepID=A0A0G1GMW7_9BACT|nr:MAG: Glutamyl-tRNA(Gln) amidotransferase subunit A [Candidatus Collierbacteria bacterium GW2011_GWA1_44_12]